VNFLKYLKTKYYRGLHNRILDKKIVNLEESQYWSLSKLQAFQDKRLRKIVSYAYRNIPMYREKMIQNKVKPKDINSIADLPKLPITTREEMQANPGFVNKYLVNGALYTGGSTGSSLKYFESRASSRIREGVHLRGWSWNGYVYGKKMAIISSAQGNLEGKNRLGLIGDLTEKNLKENVEKLIQFEPEYLRGYVSSLYILAKYCHDNNITLKSIKAINPISENLYDYQRELMEEVFNCRVFEEYVCNDGGACAWECDEHKGLHYFMERAIIEEIDGEMIVTDLWNKAMPFIRYRNGDSVSFLDTKCSCGRDLPLVKVKGRDNDVIISKKGIISPTFLMHHGIGIAGADKKQNNFRTGIRTVQYIQKPNYVLDINIVKNSWCTDEEISDFTNKIEEIVQDMTFNIKIVKEIAATKKGKRQFIINEDLELLKKWKK
jgi:phenylacetate-CoA ligase